MELAPQEKLPKENIKGLMGADEVYALIADWRKNHPALEVIDSPPKMPWIIDGLEGRNFIRFVLEEAACGQVEPLLIDCSRVQDLRDKAKEYPLQISARDGDIKVVKSEPQELISLGAYPGRFALTPESFAIYEHRRKSAERKILDAPEARETLGESAALFGRERLPEALFKLTDKTESKLAALGPLSPIDWKIFRKLIDSFQKNSSGRLKYLKSSKIITDSPFYDFYR